MKKHVLLAFGILFLNGILFPQFSTAQNNPITFEISKGIGKVQGYFEKIDYTIKLDNPSNYQMSGTADVAKIQTNNSKRDADLQKKNWFDASQFPKISMQSTSVEKVKDNHFTAQFDITIKGITQHKTIDFYIQDQWLVADFTLNINDFDLGGGMMKILVGKEVEVSLQLPYP